MHRCANTLREGNLVSVGKTSLLSSTPTSICLMMSRCFTTWLREQGARDDLTYRRIQDDDASGAAHGYLPWAATRIDKSTRAHWLISRSSISLSIHHLRPGIEETLETLVSHGAGIELSHGDIRRKALQQRLVTTRWT